MSIDTGYSTLNRDFIGYPHDGAGEGMRRFGLWSFFASFVFAISPGDAIDTHRSESESLVEFAGVYAAGPYSIVRIEADQNYIAATPPFWTSKPYFEPVGGDGFVMVLPDPEPDRTITFHRDGEGRVVALVMAGVEGEYDGERFNRLESGARQPAALFAEGRAAEAVRAALDDSVNDPEDLYDFALRQLINYPSRNPDTVEFLEIASAAFPSNAELKALYGYALVSVDRRNDARVRLDEALRLDPDNHIANEAIRRLEQVEPAPHEGYRAVLPFRLDSIFAPPTFSEIAAQRERWASRESDPSVAVAVHSFVLELDHASFDGRIFRYATDGGDQYGAILVPQNVSGDLPVLVDAKGVDVAYSPRDISAGTTTMRALGAAQNRFAIVIPAMRGNTLVVGDHEFASEGDPSDAWSGPVADTLGLLDVALAGTPQADPTRVAIIGYSRGGTVALLAGEQDDRIGLVLNIVGPVDQFEARAQPVGWTMAEILADTMRDGTPPSFSEEVEAAQYFDHFLDRVRDEDESLEEVRMRMLASSPLYFVDSLPETHSYYGAEDRFVPRAHPDLLRDRLERLHRLRPDMTIKVFEGVGHDTDPRLVQRDTVGRLLEWAGRSQD